MAHLLWSVVERQPVSWGAGYAYRLSIDLGEGGPIDAIQSRCTLHPNRGHREVTETDQVSAKSAVLGGSARLGAHLQWAGRPIVLELRF